VFHATAQKLAPLSERLMQHIAQAEVVQADETPLKMLSPERKGYVWTFLHQDLIGYRFSGDRSGLTPQQVLGRTQGTLVVDAYTGYNRVTQVQGRERAGCLAHYPELRIIQRGHRAESATERDVDSELRIRLGRSSLSAMRFGQHDTPSTIGGAG
jgi:transposase